jgi:hypothetical protein
MKILKKGILPKTHQEYRGRCKVCGCEVSATKGDPDLKLWMPNTVFMLSALLRVVVDKLIWKKCFIVVVRFSLLKCVGY